MKYVGIDLHNRFLVAAVEDARGRPGKPRRFECQNTEGIQRFFGTLGPFRQGGVAAQGPYSTCSSRNQLCSLRAAPSESRTSETTIVATDLAPSDAGPPGAAIVGECLYHPATHGAGTSQETE